MPFPIEPQKMPVVTMQKGGMRRIKTADYALEIVAFQIRLDDMHSIIGKAAHSYAGNNGIFSRGPI